MPSEIEVEANKLYTPGAEWNELVESATAERIDREQAVRDALGEFERRTDSDERISIGALRPAFHVKVLRLTGNVDVAADLELPWRAEVVEDWLREEPTARAIVTRERTPCQWYTDGTLVDVQYDLVVIYYAEEHQLLCICSTRRSIGTYDAIAACVTDGTFKLVPPDQLNRILALIPNPQFFSIGLKNRAAFGNAEAYRMISGRAADRALQQSDGRSYNRGHCFGRGGPADDQRTLGLSSGSKVWSASRDQIPVLLAWCAKIVQQIATGHRVTTGSGLDYVQPGEGLTAFPPELILVDWPTEVYKSGQYVVQVDGGTNPHLLDLELSIVSSNSTEVRICIPALEGAPEYYFAIADGQWREANESARETFCSTPRSREPTSITGLFREHPPSLYTSRLERIEGATIYRSSGDEPFDRALIEEVDWGAAQTDPLREKPLPVHAPRSSIFEWLESRLRRLQPDVLINDDGAGEMADFVTITDSGGTTRVVFYHCKASSRTPVPGQRVKDVYEVAGQAVKCMRWADQRRLKTHVHHRHQNTQAGRFLVGDLHRTDDLLSDGRGVQFEIVIVQPSIGRSASTPILELLAAANTYLSSAGHGPLRVIGSSTTQTTPPSNVGTAPP